MDIGVIGIGKMGKNHLRVYSELRWVNKLYLYDSNQKLMKDFSDKYDGVNACNSLEEILNKVEAVSICTPTNTHFEITKKALEKGINVLIEKPIVQRLSDGKELIKLKNKSDLICGVGHIERFNPIVEEINKFVKNPRYLEIKRHNPSSQRLVESSVIEDLMIHDIDLIWHNFYVGFKNFEIFPVGDSNFCKVIVKFNKDHIADFSASRISSRKIRTIYIENKNVSVEGSFMDQEVFLYKRPTKYASENDRYIQENIIEKVLINKTEPLKKELKTFIECVKLNEQFPVTLEQGLFNLEIVEVIKNKL